MGTAPRQTFQGSDDILLLSRVAQAPPWRQRGVMEAWLQIAQALNADASCSLSTLTAAATRARFFRMVAQRRAGQDKMLRRHARDERQYQHKLEKLDALIARMDTDEDETLLHHLLREVDVEGEDAGHMLPLPASNPYVPQPAPPASVQRPQHACQRQQAALPAPATLRPQGQAQWRPSVAVGNAAPKKPSPYAVQASASTSRTVAPSPSQYKQVQKTPLVQRPPSVAAVVIPVDSPESDHRVVARPRPTGGAPPAKRLAAGEKAAQVVTSNAAGSGGSDGWEGIAGRALEFMQRKLELDSEAAEADRAWRREVARTREEEMKIMREQTDRLIHAVLELAKAKS